MVQSVRQFCKVCLAEKKHICICKSEGWLIYKCLSCTNAMTLPSPSHYDYQKDDFTTRVVGTSMSSGSGIPPRIAIANSVNLDILSAELKGFDDTLSILEVGCGGGIFLESMKKHFSSVKLYGIEPSVEASKIARSKGFHVVTGFFPEALSRLPKYTFNLVVMSHVLEHLPDPISVLNELHERTKYLLLVQTKYTSLMPYIQRKTWHGWCPDQHFYHFTPKGISVLADKTKFKCVDIRYSSLGHGQRKLISLIDQAANIWPEIYDQFHILLEN